MFLPGDGYTLLTGGNDGLVKVWDVQVEEGGAESWDQNFGHLVLRLILVQTTDTARWSLYGPKGTL